MTSFILRLTTPVLAIVLTACAVPSNEPANLSVLKKEVAEYIDSGVYEKDLAKISETANAWIIKRSATGSGKLAIVFDIDETVLSNLPHIREEDWGYDPDIWGKWVAKSSAPALVSVREVYRTAIANNVTVFFITGRREYERTSTAKNLKAQGMGTYGALILKPSAFPSSKPAAEFKAPQRKLIDEKGYTIIASIGDQQSDLDGGHAEKTFKLPNPFYLIP